VEELARQQGAGKRSLIFYFWGYAMLSPERGATLLLDGPKLSSFSLARLRRLLHEVADEALVLIDATLADGSEGAPLDVVRAMGGALSGGDSHISSLVSVRSPGRRVEQGPPAFTGLVQMILDAQTGSPDPLTPEALFRTMQSEEVMFADIPAAGCFVARTDFVIVPAAAPSLSPPALRSFPAAASSLPPPPPRRAPAPPAPAEQPLYDETEEVTAKRAMPPPPPPPPLPPPGAALPPVARAAAPSEEPVTVPVATRVPLAPPPPPPPPPPAQGGGSTAPGGAYGPEDPAGYRFLFGHYQRKGERDAAYRAALCLEALGEADINESLLVEQHRPDGLQAVRGTLSYADWNERLASGAREPEVTALLRTIADVLPRVGFQHVRRQRQDRELGDDTRQDLEKSTTTLAKTLHWASRLLCVPVPELYVLPELEGSLGLIPGPERPLVACSRALGSGFSLPELVFLWARELAFARPEEAAICYFPTVTELSQLLLAALAAAGNVGLRSIDGDAKRLASALKREVRGAPLIALQAAAARIDPDDVGRCAVQFLRGAELVAGRVGLAASGSVEAALALSTRFPRGRATDVAERRADLLRFATSAELGQIRAELGVALGSR
jgi:hypothetical protein